MIPARAAYALPFSCWPIILTVNTFNTLLLLPLLLPLCLLLLRRLLTSHHSARLFAPHPVPSLVAESQHLLPISVIDFSLTPKGCRIKHTLTLDAVTRCDPLLSTLAPQSRSISASAHTRNPQPVWYPSTRPTLVAHQSSPTSSSPTFPPSTKRHATESFKHSR